MFNGDVDETEEPASAMVELRSGSYDIKNMPGHKRKQLIESGEIAVDRFIQADNVPGYKLKPMRDALRKNLAASGIVENTLNISTLEVGGLVTYKKTTVEIKKINVEKKKVYINVKGLHKGWVSIDKLKPVVIPKQEEEED